MSVTLIDPWSDKREFFLGRRECEAIAEVDPAVAKRKKLHSEQVLAAKCLEPQLLSHKYRRICSLHFGGRSTASDRGPLLSQSSWSVSPLLRTSAAKARATVATAGGISGSSTSQSFVAREMTPRRLRAAPPTTTASKPTPRSSRNRSNRWRRLRESMSISVTDTTFRNKPLYGGLSRTLPGRSTCLLLAQRRTGTVGQTACWTKRLKLLKSWPMVTDHPFSSS